MRVTVNISKTDKNLISDLMKLPLLNSKKMVIRSAIVLGLSNMVKGGFVEKNNDGNEHIKFNTKTIDPEGIFEVMAYYIITKRLGASMKNKKIIIASKEELCETIGEALILGIIELPNSIYGIRC